MPIPFCVIARGIRRKPRRDGFEAFARAAGKTVTRYFRNDTSVAAMIRWQEATRTKLREGAAASRLRKSVDYLPSVPVPTIDAGAAFVYFIQNDRFVKIGCTRDVRARLTELQIAHPHELRLVAVLRCADMRATEADLHRRFAADHVRGEWFQISDAVREFIRELAEPTPERDHRKGGTAMDSIT